MSTIKSNEQDIWDKSTPYFEVAEQLKVKCSDKYEMVNHPKHYNNYDIEVIDMMERIWGKEDTIKWCQMTAFKYRMRMGTKPTSDIKEDLDKEKWYLNKAKEIKNKK